MAMTVRMMQTQLHFLCFYNDRIDGKWGKNSRNATIAFQKEFGLTQDGIFGAATEAKTKAVVLEIQKIVKKYNNLLICDGLAGAVTMSAVKSYQKAMGLKVTGLANAETRKSMKVGNSDSAGNIVANTNTPVFSTGTSTKPSTGTWWDKIKYFERDEFKCKCGGKYCNGFNYEPKEALVKLLDKVREHFGKSITITSGLRCTIHNKNEGGVSNSRHITGKAADFKVNGVSASAVDAYLSSIGGSRYHYKINANCVHVDVL